MTVAALPRLVGGDIALDLCNTIDDERDPEDYLRDDAHAAAWLAHVGLPGDASASDLRRVRGPIDAALRATKGSDPLVALGALYAEAVDRAALAPGGFTWATPADAIVASAVQLITHGPMDRLRTCGNCPWLFLDLSKNGSRRWCSMEGCGTEVKIRRLTERRRAART